ncbi:unnamed protein product [Peniophora sp. CBMAI 1063]|nr:unnamed protein product [Peniophora sp. CBMAI 1063]
MAGGLSGRFATGVCPQAVLICNNDFCSPVANLSDAPVDLLLAQAIRTKTDMDLSSFPVHTETRTPLTLVPCVCGVRSVPSTPLHPQALFSITWPTVLYYASREHM